MRVRSTINGHVAPACESDFSASPDKKGGNGWGASEGGKIAKEAIKWRGHKAERPLRGGLFRFMDKEAMARP